MEIYIFFFSMFKKAAFIWSKYNKNNKIGKYYYNENIFLDLMYFTCCLILNFQQPLLQSSVSHNASEIIYFAN